MPFDPRTSTRLETVVPRDDGEWLAQQAERLGVPRATALRMILLHYRRQVDAGQLDLLTALFPGRGAPA